VGVGGWCGAVGGGGCVSGGVCGWEGAETRKTKEFGT
jgi:hypothetical protein